MYPFGEYSQGLGISPLFVPVHKCLFKCPAWFHIEEYVSQSYNREHGSCKPLLVGGGGVHLNIQNMQIGPIKTTTTTATTTTKIPAVLF